MMAAAFFARASFNPDTAQGLPRAALQETNGAGQALARVATALDDAEAVLHRPRPHPVAGVGLRVEGQAVVLPPGF